MIDLDYIKGFYPPAIAGSDSFTKHLLKEYVELTALEFLSRCQYANKITFIGGTNLRLVHGIDRFSEDLDFDVKGLTEAEFIQMTEILQQHLVMQGIPAEIRDKDNERLTAYRRSIYFPGWLFDLHLTGHKEERFLMKVEAQDQDQDQGIRYPVEMAKVDRCGFYFPIAVPPDSVLLSMKLAALLARAKGRDFYDVLFLMQRTSPDYDYLQQRCGISGRDELVMAIDSLLESVNLENKCRDFEHLIFTPAQSLRVLEFAGIYKSLMMK